MLNALNEIKIIIHLLLVYLGDMKNMPTPTLL